MHEVAINIAVVDLLPLLFYEHLHSWGCKETTTDSFLLFIVGLHDMSHLQSSYIFKLSLPIDHVVEAPLSRAIPCIILDEPREGLYDIIGGQYHFNVWA